MISKKILTRRLITQFTKGEKTSVDQMDHKINHHKANHHNLHSWNNHWWNTLVRSDMFFHHCVDHHIKTNHPTKARHVDNDAINPKRIISQYPSVQSAHNEAAYVAISSLYNRNRITIPENTKRTISL
jgi:hypothetical protein